MKGYLLTFLLLLSGCSANWHMKKALKKDPSIVEIKTVKVVDTVFIEVEKIDTLFKYKFDTVTFWKDSIYVKYFYQTQDSLVYLEVDCPDNEVITNTVTETKTIVIKPTLWEKIQSGFTTLIVLWIIIVVGYVLKKTLL